MQVISLYPREGICIHLQRGADLPGARCYQRIDPLRLHMIVTLCPNQFQFGLPYTPESEGHTSEDFVGERFFPFFSEVSASFLAYLFMAFQEMPCTFFTYYGNFRQDHERGIE